MLPIQDIGGRTGDSLVPFVVIKTTKVGPLSFNFSKTGSPLTWDMGDGTIHTNTNFVLHNYILAGEKTIIVYGDDVSLLTGISSNNNREITYVDLSLTTNISGQINFNTNPLTTFIQPASTGNCEVSLNTTLLSGVLDVSNIKVAGAFYTYGTAITSITHNTDNTQFTDDYRIHSSDITGTHDMKGVRITSGNAWFLDNPSLTSLLLNADLNQICNSFGIDQCDITGVLDLSNLEIKTFYQFYDNPNLTDIIHKATTAINMNRYFAWNTGLVNLDLSMISDLQGSFRIYSCSDLETINFSSGNATLNNTVLTSFWFHDNPKLLGLDFTGFTSVTGNFNLHTNPLSTFYTFNPTPSGKGCIMVLYDNNSIVNIDFSMLTIEAVLDIFRNSLLEVMSINNTTNSLPLTRVRLMQNPNVPLIDLSKLVFDTSVTSLEIDVAPGNVIKTIIPPISISSTTGTLNAYNNPSLSPFDPSGMSSHFNIDNHFSRYFNNNWSAAQVNELLVQLDGIILPGFINRTLQIGGNAAPDATSGGFDGLAAQSSIIGKGVTIA